MSSKVHENHLEKHLGTSFLRAKRHQRRRARINGRFRRLKYQDLSWWKQWTKNERDCCSKSTIYRSVIAFRHSVFHLRNLTCAGKTVNTQLADRHVIVDPVPVFLRQLAGFRCTAANNLAITSTMIMSGRLGDTDITITAKISWKITLLIEKTWKEKEKNGSGEMNC